MTISTRSETAPRRAATPLPARALDIPKPSRGRSRPAAVPSERRAPGQTSDGWTRLILNVRRTGAGVPVLRADHRLAIDELIAQHPRDARSAGRPSAAGDTRVIEVSADLSAKAIRTLSRIPGLSVTSVTALLSASAYRKPHRESTSVLDALALAQDIRNGLLADRVCAAMRVRALPAEARDAIAAPDRDALAAAIDELGETVALVFEAAYDSELDRAPYALTGLDGLRDVVRRLGEAVVHIDAPSSQVLLERGIERAHLAVLDAVAADSFRLKRFLERWLSAACEAGGSASSGPLAVLGRKDDPVRAELIDLLIERAPEDLIQKLIIPAKGRSPTWEAAAYWDGAIRVLAGVLRRTGSRVTLEAVQRLSDPDRGLLEILIGHPAVLDRYDALLASAQAHTGPTGTPS